MTTTVKDLAGQPAVLLVDGDVSVRTSSAEYLRHDGFAVVEASRGKEALDILQTASFDLVITAKETPGSIDGLFLLHWLQQHRPDTKTMLSAPYNNLEQSFPRDTVLLAKPYHLSDLNNAVRACLKPDKRVMRS